MRTVRKHDLSTLAPYHFDVAHKIGQGWVTRPLTKAEMQMIFDRGMPELASVNDVFGKESYLGYKTVVRADDVPDLPDDKIFKKHRVVNGNFKKRKSQGEIIMAPYRVDNVKLSYQYGVVPSNQRDPRFQIVQPRSFRLDPWGKIKFDSEWESANFGAMTFSMTSYLWDEGLVSPQSLGWDISAKHVLDKFLALRVPDSTLVTSALAGANEGKMDLLTTLAEVPETIRSLLDG